MALEPKVVEELRAARERPGRVVVLTGAGISAESGIPTFRGPEGYWTIGAKEYMPQELATAAMFRRHPETLWSWYLYRRAACSGAAPNEAHRALVRLEEALEDRFLLVTQNVDGLHLRAGSSPTRTFQIHGNIDYVRCADACGAPVGTTPDFGPDWPRGRSLDATERAALHCATCGAWLRPHVLWFDETYDEERYRWDSTLAAARDAALLLVVGTSGATTLPILMAETAFERGTVLVDVNPDDNPFGRLARASGGICLRGSAVALLPAVVEALAGRG